jgi:membrane-associated protein
MTWLTDLPVAGQLAIAALLLIADAGLLIGIVVPSAAALVALGMQVGAGTLPLVPAVALAAAASATGGYLGHRLARRRRPAGRSPARGSGTAILRRLHGRVDAIGDRMGDRVSRRPTLAAAGGQFFAGARTAIPRLAARAGVPAAKVLAGTIPAAVVWAGAMIGGGALLSTAIAAAAAVIGDLLMGPHLLLIIAAVGGLLYRHQRGHAVPNRSLLPRPVLG